ncbi:putative elastin a [Penaeus vannamei]|uniref:Putative elastin a n=1 Tax=Penaeus vannamei TaxID=6689 RepID=A0A423SVT7_PENVA|nr:putative elastin a [Penaeus vannamei]
MKAVLALCLLGAASAAVVPLTYTAGTYPFAGGFVPYNAARFPFSAGVLPYSYGVQPITYVAKPVTTQVVQPGYVAQTKGSTHIAPLPSGLGYASHHINGRPPLTTTCGHACSRGRVLRRGVLLRKSPGATRWCHAMPLGATEQECPHSENCLL